MTSRTLVEISPAALQSLAHTAGGAIEIDNTLSRAFLRIGTTTFVCELVEPTC